MTIPETTVCKSRHGTCRSGDCWSLVKTYGMLQVYTRPLFGAGSCVQLVKKFLTFCGTRRFINNSPSLIAVMSQISPISWKTTLKLNFHVRLDLSKVFPTKSLCSNVFFNLTCFMPFPFNHPSFVHSYATWCGVQIMNLLVIPFSPVSITAELHLTGLIRTASLTDMQKIQIIGVFVENRIHWQFEVRLLLFIVCTCVRLRWSSG
jgi:hypothetical protein